MARMLSQLPLPLMPAGAAEIAPGVGMVAGEDGGLVIVHGLATFAWEAGDEAGRRQCSWSGCEPRRRARWRKRSEWTRAPTARLAPSAGFDGDRPVCLILIARRIDLLPNVANGTLRNISG